jgi:hypothetical protein
MIGIEGFLRYISEIWGRTKCFHIVAVMFHPAVEAGELMTEREFLGIFCMI